jgi:pimeloyl-ACP methyl ester carboxylesterase
MKRLTALLGDSVMCGMMYVLQRRHRLPPDAREQAERYLATHLPAGRERFFAPEQSALGEHPTEENAHHWPSPVPSPFPENLRCRALLFPCAQGWSAPTVIMLHALMSASDRGYREWARRFNARGWNAIFVHLPYHYSRTPRRHLNGELAITADLLRTAEGLRAGVMEVRQLLAWLRARGGSEFGLWASSYGAWIGALVASLERDFRWMCMLEPIADLGDALWRSAAGRAIRRHFVLGRIPPELVTRFAPYICPTHARPLDDRARVLIAGGEYDRIARPQEIRAMHQRWAGSTLRFEPQGHFGFRLMQSAWQWLEAEGLL